MSRLVSLEEEEKREEEEKQENIKNVSSLKHLENPYGTHSYSNMVINTKMHRAKLCFETAENTYYTFKYISINLKEDCIFTLLYSCLFASF